jgi:hypothetical protein
MSFIMFSIRSIFCIIITTCKNIYQSYTSDQLISLPPDEHSIEQLESVLHVPIAVKYFWEYLEEFKDTGSKLDNYYRLLALYMDIRCYDVEVRKHRQNSIAQNHQHSSCQEKDTQSSMISNISFNENVDYVEESKFYAITIFDEYIRNEGNSWVDIDDQIRVEIFQKFGCEIREDADTENGLLPEHFDSELINEQTLITNLNQLLF